MSSMHGAVYLPKSKYRNHIDIFKVDRHKYKCSWKHTLMVIFRPTGLAVRLYSNPISLKAFPRHPSPLCAHGH